MPVLVLAQDHTALCRNVCKSLQSVYGIFSATKPLPFFPPICVEKRLPLLVGFLRMGCKPGMLAVVDRLRLKSSRKH
jgi:hypothetical protein